MVSLVSLTLGLTAYKRTFSHSEAGALGGFSRQQKAADELEEKLKDVLKHGPMRTCSIAKELGYSDKGMSKVITRYVNKGLLIRKGWMVHLDHGHAPPQKLTPEERGRLGAIKANAVQAEKLEARLKQKLKYLGATATIIARELGYADRRGATKMLNRFVASGLLVKVGRVYYLRSNHEQKGVQAVSPINER